MENQPTISQPKLSIRFFFLSLGSLVGLVVSATSFLNLAFATLDKKFPDVLNATYQYGYNTYEFTAMRSSLATLIIFFPIFLLVSYFWKKYQRGEMGRVDEIVRKWMMYLILFLSSIVIAVDLVTLVRYFISGEITTRFILKIIVALAVALIVGCYYMFELMGKKKFLGFNVGIWTAIKASVWVLLLIVFSFCVMGSPFKQRLLRLDDRRVQDLQSVQSQVISYWQQKAKLPEKLTDLANPLGYYSLPVDPEFEKGKVYEYAKKGDLSFEICATFAMPMPKGWQEYNYGNGKGIAYPVSIRENTNSDGSTIAYPYPGGTGNDSWDHQTGRTCFSRTIDKDMYPVYPKPL